MTGPQRPSKIVATNIFSINDQSAKDIKLIPSLEPTNYIAQQYFCGQYPNYPLCKCYRDVAVIERVVGQGVPLGACMISSCVKTNNFVPTLDECPKDLNLCTTIIGEKEGELKLNNVTITQTCTNKPGPKPTPGPSLPLIVMGISVVLIFIIIIALVYLLV